MTTMASISDRVASTNTALTPRGPSVHRGHRSHAAFSRQLPFPSTRIVNSSSLPPFSGGKARETRNCNQSVTVAAIAEDASTKTDANDENSSEEPPAAPVDELAARIASGEFTVSAKRDTLGPLRKAVAKAGPGGRSVAKLLADLERKVRLLIPESMPEARGDVRAIVGQPFFVPLYNLFLVYGGVFMLAFGPKKFVIVSDAEVARYILRENAKSFSKGILSEILDFVMGTGLIPADGEIWIKRRRAISPSIHRRFVTAMIGLFRESADRMCEKLEHYSATSETAEMESLFSRLTLDVIGKAVFNYEFDSLNKDTGITEAVYVTLREAEARSTSLFPYWKVPVVRSLWPGQQKVNEALVLINATLDELIDTCKRMVEEEGDEFYEEYVNKSDPSILRFLLASGDEVSSKQLRDDLMTMLIAGHETSAAVLTWTFYLLSQNPDKMKKLQKEIDEVLGDRVPTMEDFRRLKYTTRVINESMRLYPQPPVLIRRSLGEDTLGGYAIGKGTDIFISVWNLHRNPKYWERHDEFWPERWDVNGPDPNEVSENFNYLPFGGGQRKCIGDVFATFELIVSIATIARRFDVKLAPGARVEMTTGATIHTSFGLPMIILKRGEGESPLSPSLDVEYTKASIP